MEAADKNLIYLYCVTGKAPKLKEVENLVDELYDAKLGTAQGVIVHARPDQVAYSNAEELGKALTNAPPYGLHTGSDIRALARDFDQRRKGTGRGGEELQSKRRLNSYTIFRDGENAYYIDPKTDEVKPYSSSDFKGTYRPN